jgi:hypothetical protein
VDPAPLRYVTYRAYSGQLERVWTLTPVGYLQAEAVLGRTLKVPKADVGANFLAHAVALNELYVGLLMPSLTAEFVRIRTLALPSQRRKAIAHVFASARHSTFRWHACESVRLPWRELKGISKGDADRLIVPDAVEEIPSLSKRFFLECEMGTHSIVAASDEKVGATIAKLKRYASFLNDFEVLDFLNPDVRRHYFYAAAYPDKWPVELWFVVRTESRAKSVRAAVKEETEAINGLKITARALTFEQATRTMVDLLCGVPNGGADASPPARPGDFRIHESQARALVRFYGDAVRNLKGARHQVRAVPEETRQQLKLSEPEYPADIDRIRALAQELSERFPAQSAK